MSRYDHCINYAAEWLDTMRQLDDPRDIAFYVSRSTLKPVFLQRGKQYLNWQLKRRLRIRTIERHIGVGFHCLSSQVSILFSYRLKLIRPAYIKHLWYKATRETV